MGKCRLWVNVSWVYVAMGICRMGICRLTDLRPTSYSKKEEVQSVFMSLVQFFDGQFKVVVHRDPRIRRYDKEVMWMSPAPNLCFNDTVAGVDRKMLEKAQQIFRTSVPRR